MPLTLSCKYLPSSSISFPFSTNKQTLLFLRHFLCLCSHLWLEAASGNCRLSPGSCSLIPWDQERKALRVHYPAQVLPKIVKCLCLFCLLLVPTPFSLPAQHQAPEEILHTGWPSPPWSSFSMQMCCRKGGHVKFQILQCLTGERDTEMEIIGNKGICCTRGHVPLYSPL